MTHFTSFYPTPRYLCFSNGIYDLKLPLSAAELKLAKIIECVQEKSDKIKIKQGRLHDNPWRGRLGRGSNELGRGSND